MGLSLAQRALATVGSDGDVQEALGRFVELCDDNSRDGFVGAAYEALGLVARNLYPQMVEAIDRRLAARDDDLGAHFWHGVGRAVYFAPTNFLPGRCSRRRIAEALAREPPHPLAARNAVAGLAWAMALVNIRHPEILQAFLGRFVPGALDADAFADGVSSAIVIWHRAAPDDPDLEAFCRHRPASDPATAALWNEVVSEPCARALREDASGIRGGPGELFRHRPRERGRR